MNKNGGGTRPLSGRLVIDLTSALAGPYATLLLAGLGATVMKIENPAVGGDSSRTNPPYVGTDGLSRERTGDRTMSLSMMARGRNKLSVTLNLKKPEGRAVFLDLVRVADLIVENYAAGTADRLGVGYGTARAVNPAIVYASISGFGQSGGSDGTDKAMDSIIQALSGVMMTAGDPDDPPVRFGLPIGDLLAPLFCVIGVLAALMQADGTGLGQHVDVSMLGALTSLVACEPFDALALLGLPTRTGQTVPRLAPFGMFEASDGWVALCAPTDEFARALFRGIGRPDLASDDRFERSDRRVRHADELHALIGDWARARSRDEVVSALSAAGVPVSAVRTPGESLLDQRLRDRGEVVALTHPDLGETDFLGPGIPIRFSATTTVLDQPAPYLGEHTAEILGKTLGYSAEHIAMLAQAGVI